MKAVRARRSWARALRRSAGFAGLLTLLLPPVNAGSPTAPEVRDATGDAAPGTAPLGTDLEAPWFEWNQTQRRLHITLQVSSLPGDARGLSYDVIWRSEWNGDAPVDAFTGVRATIGETDRFVPLNAGRRWEDVHTAAGGALDGTKFPGTPGFVRWYLPPRMAHSNLREGIRLSEIHALSTTAGGSPVEARIVDYDQAYGGSATFRPTGRDPFPLPIEAVRPARRADLADPEGDATNGLADLVGLWIDLTPTRVNLTIAVRELEVGALTDCDWGGRMGLWDGRAIEEWMLNWRIHDRGIDGWQTQLRNVTRAGGWSDNVSASYVVQTGTPGYLRVSADRGAWPGADDWTSADVVATTSCVGGEVDGGSLHTAVRIPSLSAAALTVILFVGCAAWRARSRA